MSDKRPIIIKRVQVIAGGHHGGAWKVAYADFVTAMMAFFLLLWLLGATNETQRKGIADYFTPNPSVSNSMSGSGGVMGGMTMTVPGPMASPGAPMQMSDMPAGPETIGKGDPDAEVTGSGVDGEILEEEPADIEKAIRDAEKNGDAKALEKAQKALDDARFRDVQEKLEKQLASDPDLLELGSNVRIERTPEGLRIQIIDQEKWSMFQSGGSDLSQRSIKLIAAVSKSIAEIPNKVSIRGHTDSKPFPPGSRKDNWILSAERANATRSVMVTSGVSSSRVAGVTGLADIEPISSDPLAPENRRISIMLLAQKPAAPGGTPPALDGQAINKAANQETETPATTVPSLREPAKQAKPPEYIPVPGARAQRPETIPQPSIPTIARATEAARKAAKTADEPGHGALGSGGGGTHQDQPHGSSHDLGDDASKHHAGEPSSAPSGVASGSVPTAAGHTQAPGLPTAGAEHNSGGIGGGSGEDAPGNPPSTTNASSLSSPDAGKAPEGLPSGYRLTAPPAPPPPPVRR